MEVMVATTEPVRTSESDRAGKMLRDWRLRKGLSQLALSLQAGISARHLSFVETGRSVPSTELIVHLGEHLEIPLRERNRILLAAGHAPVYSHHRPDDPELAVVRSELSQMIAAVEPVPAVICDRHWGLVEANGTIAVLLDGCAPHLLEPPANVLRLTLHPDGMAPRIANLATIRNHLIGQVRRRAEWTGDRVLADLARELSAYSSDSDEESESVDDSVVVPLRLRHPDGELSFFTMAAALTSARDVTIDEYTVELFAPADGRTREFLTDHA
ncbi:MAG: helix-turn-helix transcriptional regulator [Gordonia polyisoprenivorans]|nr:helix-turn-helix transcriptional regulator [Gordonia polyisoprenivorans]